MGITQQFGHLIREVSLKVNRRVASGFYEVTGDGMELLAYLASWAGAIVGIWVLFARAEDVVRPEVRDGISRWLQKIDPERAVSNWPKTFAAVFDQLFGERHLSWRCFRRSCVASLATFFIIALLWTGVYPGRFAESVNFLYEADIKFPFIVLLAIIGNVIPDYLSLFESRMMIKVMEKLKRKIFIGLLLLIDLLLTGFIFFSCAFIGLIISVQIVTGVPFYVILKWFVNDLPLIFLSFVTFEKGTGPESFSDAIWFYSTYFTSIWIWIYAFSLGVVRIAVMAGGGMTWFRKVFDIQNKPLRSAGYVAVGLVTVIYLVVLPTVL